MADYDAFISYSHALDKPIAATLQTAIQRLGKPWYRRRALRIFRDDTSLSATPHLWPSIEQALARSRYLILLISPQSAASPWVGKEVAYWLANKSIDTFLMAVTDGEVGWDRNQLHAALQGPDWPEGRSSQLASGWHPSPGAGVGLATAWVIAAAVECAESPACCVAAGL